MEKNADGEYMDSVLDTIPEITHKELSSIWYKPSDSVRFEMTLGIYLDNEYPSDAVRETVFKKLNSIIPKGFSYDIDDRQESLLKSGVKTMQSVKNLLDGRGNLFIKVCKLNGYNPKFANYPMIVIPIDDNMVNEPCPTGGHHQIKYDTDDKMIICEKCGKFLYSRKYYDKRPPSDANSLGVG